MTIFDFLKPKWPKNDTIKNKLQKLKSLDKDEHIFGSSSHKYKINAPLSAENIAAFEKRHGIVLPEAYRLFLTSVANGGAGPFYGLYPLNENNDAFPKIDISKPFEYTYKNPLNMMETYDQLPEDISDEAHEEILDELFTKAHRGFLFLATEGCGIYSILIVNGIEYGNVWYYDLANDAGIFPLISPCSGKSMNFLEWYTLWLDQSIKSLETGKEEFSSYCAFIMEMK